MNNTSRVLRAGLLVGAAGGIGVVAVSCGAPEAALQETPGGGMSVGSVVEGQTKCKGGTNGDANYCTSAPGCTCDQGEGDCDSPDQCTSPLRCSGKGLNFCFPTNINVCAPAHCNNKVQDADETQPDCGGSCGTCCPSNPCNSLPPLGQAGHCTAACPCADLQGGCKSGSQCTSGVCKLNSGAFVGYPANIGVCVAATCSNSKKDGDETGIDCGGSCLPCTALAESFGGTGSGAKNDTILGTAYDTSGNLFVAGRTSSQSINFGSGALTLHGGSDIFLAKFDKNGNNIWSKLIGGTGNDGDAGVDVSVAPSGYVVLAGNFYTSVDFGGGAVTAGGTSDAFVAKYTNAGNYVWAKHFGGMGGNRASGVTADAKGNIIITGSYQNTINLGGSTFTAVSAGSGNVFDIFVAKFSPAGVHLWSKSYGSAGSDQGLAVRTDGSNNVYVAGFFADAIDFGTGTQTSAGSSDALGLALASNNGATLWADHWGGVSDDRANAVNWNGGSNVVFAGYFKDKATFGSDSYTSAGANDAFVASAAISDGTVGWSHQLGGTGVDIAFGLASRSDGAVAVGGGFQSSVNFGGTSRTSAGGTDIFAAYFSSTGAYISDSVYGGTGNDQANALASTPAFVAVGGQFTSPTLSFGGPSFADTAALDAFWARLAF